MTKAVRIHEYGPIDVLRVEDIEVGDPPAGEVRVAVRAAGINPGEAKIRTGALQAMFPATLPHGQGSDLAGVVDAVGDGVDAFAPGDEVLGWSWGRSSQAEAVLVPADQLIPKPAGLPWDVAGALYVAGATAWAAVQAVGAGTGDTIAVSAAAGGVGSLAAQLVGVRGATAVGIASASNDEFLRSLGVTPVTYGDGLADRLRSLAPDGLDGFIDTYGDEYVRLAVDLGIDRQRIDTVIAFETAEELGVKREGSYEGTSREVMTELAELAASGRITVPIAATYPLADVQQAFSELEKGHTRGKIVLTMG